MITLLFFVITLSLMLLKSFPSISTAIICPFLEISFVSVACSETCEKPPSVNNFLVSETVVVEITFGSSAKLEKSE